MEEDIPLNQQLKIGVTILILDKIEVKFKKSYKGQKTLHMLIEGLNTVRKQTINIQVIKIYHQNL